VSIVAFLIDFHNQRPGLTAIALADLPITSGAQHYPSTYALLASVVPVNAAETSVLDLACGDGFLLALLESRRQQNLHLSGIDMSTGELHRARARLQASTELIEGTAQHLPWPIESFDHVLCHMAFMLMENVEDVVREICRVLKPSGTFSAIVGASAPPSVVIQAFKTVFPKYQRKPGLEKVRFGDPRTRSSEGIRELLSPGFSNLVLKDVQITLRLTPEEVWDRFTNMYDLSLISVSDGDSVREEFLPLIHSACGAEGKLDYEENLRYFSAQRC